jgi:FdrA protein
MKVRVVIRSREYHDSVRLMQVSERIRKERGVDEAILMMATDNNKKILAASGVLTNEVADAKSDDLVVAVVASDETQADAAIETAIEQLSQRAAGAGIN